MPCDLSSPRISRNNPCNAFASATLRQAIDRNVSATVAGQQGSAHRTQNRDRGAGVLHHEIDRLLTICSTPLAILSAALLLMV
jgi:hypothetical protein